MNKHNVIDMADAIEDTAEAMAKEANLGPREMIAALCLSLVRCNFTNARDGKETSALEDAFRFMRAAHNDLMNAYLADREAAGVVH
jgi:hypothetical protein